MISPDGTRAVLLSPGPHPALEIIELTSGAEHPVPLRVDPNTVHDWRSLVWSPDSRWLFTPGADGHLYAVAAPTDQLIDLNPAIGSSLKLSQLAIRNIH